MSHLSASLRAALLLVALSSLLLAVALFTQFVMGWAPCVLCLTQRLPHYVNLAVALPLLLLAFALPHHRRRLLGLAALAAVLAFLAALLIAGYHSGVELRIWPGPQNCGGNKSTSLTALDLLGAPVVDCTKPQLMFPGFVPFLSMANAHFLLVIGGLAASLGLYRKGR